VAIYVREITPEEEQTLKEWERSYNLVAYRRARILHLSAECYKCPVIAKFLGINVETVRECIKAFNQGGIPAITPLPPSGGKRVLEDDIADLVEDLIRQSPEQYGLNKAVWTLHDLAGVIAEKADRITSISHEAVRNLLERRQIIYRRAKQWVRSPDKAYKRKKRRRDLLLAWARSTADGVVFWIDESWFAKWPYRFWAWVKEKTPLRVAQRWNEKVETIALFAALNDETQETFLRWSPRPNKYETVRFLKALMAHVQGLGKRFVVVFWDAASWHTAHRTRQWIRAYNRRAKRLNLPRLIVCVHPSGSPWLMPLEPIFGWTKRQALGGRVFDTLAELQAVVEHHLRERVPKARLRRTRAAAVATLQKSRSVS